MSSNEDLEACVTLQQVTWGTDFRELVPPALLQVSQKIGGIALGAFQGDRLVGFVFGLTGIEQGRPVHWSHMLAVDSSCRDQGIGRALKTAQRDRLMALGVERMYWTFDPLVARNAHLNLNLLGARVVEYARDMYGDNLTSRTDSVIGTDRFVVAWDLRPSTAEPAGGHGRSQAVTGGQRLIASEVDPLPDVVSVLVAIPADIQTLKLADPGAALAWRRSTRRAFEHYLALGYQVAGVGPRPDRDGSCYRLERGA